MLRSKRGAGSRQKFCGQAFLLMHTVEAPVLGRIKDMFLRHIVEVEEG